MIIILYGVLGAGDRAVNKKTKIFAFMELAFGMGIGKLGIIFFQIYVGSNTSTLINVIISFH